MIRPHHSIAIFTTFHRRGPDMLRAVLRYGAVVKQHSPYLAASVTAAHRGSRPAEPDYPPASRPTWFSRPSAA
jgi:hypothetical protein